MIRVQGWNEFVFPKFYGPLAIWPWLKIRPQSSLNVIYCLISTAWQWLMSFTYMPCIPVQIKPNKSPSRNRLLALLLWEISYLSSPSRSCLGRLILIVVAGGACGWSFPHDTISKMGHTLEKTFYKREHANNQYVYKYLLGTTGQRSANQSHNNISLHTHQSDKSYPVVVRTEQQELLPTAGRIVNLNGHCGKFFYSYLVKVNICLYAKFHSSSTPQKWVLLSNKRHIQC